MALSIVYPANPANDPSLPGELADLAGLLPVGTRILAGGRAAPAYFETLVRIQAIHTGSLEEFGEQLDALRRDAWLAAQS